MPFAVEDADHSGGNTTSVLPYQMLRCTVVRVELWVKLYRLCGRVVGRCTGVMRQGLIIYPLAKKESIQGRPISFKRSKQDNSSRFWHHALT